MIPIPRALTTKDIKEQKEKEAKKALKAATKGRFAGSSPIRAEEHVVTDKKWSEAANPAYAKLQKDREARKETILKGRVHAKNLMSI